jgi:hypothetical protein
VPEEFDVRQVEYVHLDMEPTAKLAMQALFLAEDEDNVVERLISILMAKLGRRHSTRAKIAMCTCLTLLKQ